MQSKLLVQVHPNARRNEIKDFKDGVLHIRIAASPVEGKANKELIDFLGDSLGIAKSNIIIERGLTSRKKTLLIQGLNLEAILRKLVAGSMPMPMQGRFHTRPD